MTSKPQTKPVHPEALEVDAIVDFAHKKLLSLPEIDGVLTMLNFKEENYTRMIGTHLSTEDLTNFVTHIVRNFPKKVRQALALMIMLDNGEVIENDDDD